MFFQPASKLSLVAVLVVGFTLRELAHRLVRLYVSVLQKILFTESKESCLAQEYNITWIVARILASMPSSTIQAVA